MRRATATLLALITACSLLAFGPPAGADHGPSEKTNVKVTSWDLHQVPLTVYRPLGATPEDPVPVILHSHGWSGSRATADDAFHDYVAAGFGVVSIDMRGHGEARPTSEARVHHMEFEIRDVQAVIDYVATLPWVRLDGPGDPRLGAIGGSYGGAYQLLAAAIDDRLDALVPEITWNSLPQSLVPNGGIKSAWVDVLYAAGNAFARVHPTIHQAYARAMATNELPDGTLPGEVDLVSQFTASSPAAYAEAIDVPTLLVQGMPDTLFNFNQAAANYAQIQATGAPVGLVTHLQGHILNTKGTLGNVPLPFGVGLQPEAGGTPCGSYTRLAIAWFERFLLEDASAGARPRVCIALDDGSTIVGRTFPLPGTQDTTYRVSDAVTLPMGAAGVSDELELFVADGETVIAGIPTLSGTITASGSDAIVYWHLLVVDGVTGAERILDAQVTPLRVGGPVTGAPFEIQLGGVGVRLAEGDALLLVASNFHEQFAHNGARVPGLVTLGDLSLDLPVVAPSHGLASSAARGGHGGSS